MFITASFLFWTGSGYPLATFSLFISLTSVYLSWSFEIAWHLWYLGRRFSPIWPHPTAGVAPDDSTTRLLKSRSEKEKRWFWGRRKGADSGRSPAEAKRNEDGTSGHLAPAGGEAEGIGLNDGKAPWDAKEARLQRYGSLRGGSLSARFWGGSGEAALAEGGQERPPRETGRMDVVLNMVDYDPGPVSDPVRVRDRVSARDADSVKETEQRLGRGVSNRWGDGLVGPERGSRDGLSRMATLERGYSSEVHEPTEGAASRPSGVLRHRRSRSLERVDIELGIIRTVSETSQTQQVSAGLAADPDGSPAARRPSDRQPGIEPRHRG